MVQYDIVYSFFTATESTTELPKFMANLNDQLKRGGELVEFCQSTQSHGSDIYVLLIALVKFIK